MSSNCGIVADKLAFVTGAASGIGRAICQILSREGATVVAADINIDGVNETIHLLKNSRDNLGLHCDVISSTSVNAALNAILKKYNKPPTVVVNAAGIIRANDFLNILEKDYDDVMAVNVKGTFLVMQIFTRELVQKKLEGSIINIASIVGKFGQPGCADYSASKAAIINLSDTVAKELGPHKIRVNAVLPGAIETPLLMSIPKKTVELFKIPLKRLGKPSEVAELVTFLASDRSSYMSGGSVEISGGH